jgi:hypothetical protein
LHDVKNLQLLHNSFTARTRTSALPVVATVGKRAGLTEDIGVKRWKTTITCVYFAKQNRTYSGTDEGGGSAAKLQMAVVENAFLHTRDSRFFERQRLLIQRK